MPESLDLDDCLLPEAGDIDGLPDDLGTDYGAPEQSPDVGVDLP